MASDNRRTKGPKPLFLPDYYEELGLPRHASPEEIRRTYRDLAWLLHPDRCQDDDMRRVAEAQLKRLNGIVAVLLDPEQRRRYDESLQRRDDSWPRKIRALQFRLATLTDGWPRRWIWVSGGLALFGLLTWIVVAKPNRPQQPVTPPTSARPHSQPGRAVNHAAPAKPAVLPAASPPPDAVQKAASSRKAEELPPSERDEVQTHAEVAPAPSRSPQSHTPSASEQTWPPKPLIAEATLSTTKPGEKGLARAHSARTYSGWWLLVPSTAAQASADLYPPIYVEMFVEQKGVLLRGRYRGRYHVADRAISPEVSFTFEGRAEGDEPELTWRGGQGAEGRMRLRWVGENSMEVRWWTTNFGTELGLSSGIATLIRVEERR